jgi:hypothetical protein
MKMTRWAVRTLSFTLLSFSLLGSGSRSREPEHEQRSEQPEE